MTKSSLQTPQFSPLSRRAQAMKPSATLAMAARAKEMASKGIDVVSLTVGEPDWATSAAASQAGIEAIQNGFTKYTAAAGIPELRLALAKSLSVDLGVHYEPSQVVVGSGAKFVLFAALQMLLDPLDEVIIPAPYWVSYPAMVDLAGGTSVIVPCGEKENFKLTAALLEKTINAKTKILLLCSPSNPTGLAYTKAELEEMAKILRKHPHVFVLSDDIYNALMFSDEKIAPHLLHVAPDLAGRVIAVNGASKSFSMTGWRIGWAACPLVIAKAMADFFSQSTSNVCSITQMATLKALENPGPVIAEARRLLRSRIDIFSKALSEVPGLRPCQADGAFYVWLDCRPWFGRVHAPSGKTISNSHDLAEALLEHQALATIPGSEFGTEGYLRLSFATTDADLAKAAQRLMKFSHDLGL